MGRILILLICLCFTSVSFSQIDNSTGEEKTGGIRIPAVETPEPAPDKSSVFSDNDLLKPAENTYTLPKEKKKPFSMRTDNGLMVKKLENFTPKAFTKDKEAREEFKADQYLGDFLTKGNYVELYCRDHEYVDGDKVRVYLNGVMIQNSVSLGGGYRPILVKLESGFNTIEFEALNQGTSGPNTAELKIFDDKGQHLAQKEWNLLTGAKARIVIVKN